MIPSKQSSDIRGMTHRGVKEDRLVPVRKLIERHKNLLFEYVENESSNKEIKFRYREYCLICLREGILDCDIGSILLFGVWLYKHGNVIEDKIVGKNIVKTARDAGLLAASFEYYRILLDKERYSSAIVELEGLGERNYLPANFELGRLYEFGVGVAQDSVLAEQYYQKAAKQGHIPSKKGLARLYKKSDELLNKVKGLFLYFFVMPLGLFRILSNVSGEKVARE
jgi:Sel1 repeat-containing protein